MERELYGFGDNEFGKAGGELHEKYVLKNPKLIKYETDSKSKSVIEKIFCGYHHCYIITNTGELYAWGNPKNFRLTQIFGNVIVKQPKLLQIDWKNEKAGPKKSDIDENGEGSKVDDRYILYLIKGKKNNLIIKDILVSIK
jgi:alpha-tubulin suppressor-like RCC1 family protein